MFVAAPLRQGVIRCRGNKALKRAGGHVFDGQITVLKEKRSARDVARQVSPRLLLAEAGPHCGVCAHAI